MPSLIECLNKATELVTGGNLGAAQKEIEAAQKLNTQLMGQIYGPQTRRGRPPAAETQGEQSGVATAGETAATTTQEDGPQLIYNVLKTIPSGITKQDLYAQISPLLPTWKAGTLGMTLSKWVDAGALRVEGGRYFTTDIAPDFSQRQRHRAA